MLSILIPTYQFDVTPLVQKLAKQCQACAIDFEILVLNDGGQDSNLKTKNAQINWINHCFYIEKETNNGLSFCRNYLIQKAKFEYLLLLDDDMFPEHDDFILTYVQALKSSAAEVICGGMYIRKNENNQNILRFVYGTKVESQLAIFRNQNPYQCVYFSNTCIKKSVFEIAKFDNNIKTYGYEDLLLVSEFRKKKISVQHIDNALLHQCNDTSAQYLEKTKTACLNLAILYQNNQIKSEDSKLIFTYERLYQTGLLKPFEWFFKLVEYQLNQHLLGSNPKIFWFNIVKLGVFCQYLHQKNT